jgi:hypothetical protein
VDDGGLEAAVEESPAWKAKAALPRIRVDMTTIGMAGVRRGVAEGPGRSDGVRLSNPRSSPPTTSTIPVMRRMTLESSRMRPSRAPDSPRAHESPARPMTWRTTPSAMR